jgi:hypothetical protein
METIHELYFSRLTLRKTSPEMTGAVGDRGISHSYNRQ